ncbi:MAG: hypothetical protein U0R78_06385 [Nocardioidaceae bacterium]
MKKLLLFGGLAMGYLLGTRAGRRRYEQIKHIATRVVEDPRVQETTHQAADLAMATAQQAAEAAREQAPVIKERLGEAAGKVKQGVTRS